MDSSAPVTSTVTLAIPGSILRGAQTRELRSYLVAQIACAAAIHEIDEITLASAQMYNTCLMRYDSIVTANDLHQCEEEDSF